MYNLYIYISIHIYICICIHIPVYPHELSQGIPPLSFAETLTGLGSWTWTDLTLPACRRHRVGGGDRRSRPDRGDVVCAMGLGNLCYVFLG